MSRPVTPQRFDVYQGSNYHALQQAAQIPVNDPLQLAAPIAMVTRPERQASGFSPRLERSGRYGL